MARTMKKFSAGGALGKYNRRMADIDKDYKIALAKGKNEGVAKAKYEQRKADAEDDRAKRTGADRTKTKAGEKAAEAALTEARRTKGESIKKRDMAADISKFFAGKDMTPKAAEPAKAPEAAKAKPKSRREEFNEAFRAARKDPEAMKRGVFTFRGEKFTTKMAGESPKRTGTGTGTGTTAATATPDKVKRDYTISPENRQATDAAAKKEPFSKFDRQSFVDLKVAAERGKPVNSQNPVLARMRAIAEAPGASRAAIYDYRRAVESGRYNKGGSVKKEKTMKYAKGGSTPPQPTAADRARSKKQLAELKKLKPTAEQAKVIASANRSEGPGYKKGGKMATKFGAAMKKKSADTKGRAMMKFAKGGSIDGCAVKGKTKTSMVKMKKGGSC